MKTTTSNHRPLADVRNINVQRSTLRSVPPQTPPFQLVSERRRSIPSVPSSHMRHATLDQDLDPSANPTTVDSVVPIILLFHTLPHILAFSLPLPLFHHPLVLLPFASLIKRAARNTPRWRCRHGWCARPRRPGRDHPSHSSHHRRL